MSETNECPGMETIRAGVQEWVNHLCTENATIIRDVVVIVETMQVDEESGEMGHMVNYTIPTHGTSMGAAVGLCAIGERLISDQVTRGHE